MDKTKDDITSYYVSVEKSKLIVNYIAVSFCNEVIKNSDVSNKIVK